MDTIIEKKSWPWAFVIIAAVVIASVAIALSYRGTPGRIPVQALQFAWLLLPMVMILLVNAALSYSYLKLERSQSIMLWATY